ncbi:glycosyltransferase family 4 protein [Thermoleptolyngbya oregonensis NK1-22]|uniref:Glycosyltransferase family 4 protein n=1 Tax=Thermoleptolyngbya oregonensis NK1-22 TaxID=2547457 RepID=A0AA96Y9S7_9CYAN|nr:glycosyltransferase family 4 protein [Thermoleptolyngbya oregonensis]WOB44493.1 glycosyltransferase family 4 protein [Thermoleptolyngbya oregonensis NK1-22]
MPPRPPLSELSVSLVVSDWSGGGAVRALLLAQVLQTLGCGVQLVGFQFGEALYTEPPGGMEVLAFPGASYPAILGTARRVLSHLTGDVLYAVKPKPTSFGLGLLRRLQVRRPLLLDMDDWELSWHGGDDWRYRPGPRQLARDLLKPGGALRSPDHPLYLRWLERAVPWADGLTVDTTFLQRRFGGVYLPNGKDTSLFDPARQDAAASRRRLGLSDVWVLMFPGAPRPHKGLEDLLLALEELNHPAARLVIVGGNPYDDYDEQLRSRWGRWMISLPKTPLAEMPAVLAAADVVVVPQRDTAIARAQFPLKLTDGMAMGKPVLATRVGDIPDILGDTGYLADPDSPAQLAAQLRHILAHPDEATHKGQRARDRCVARYSLDPMAIALRAVLERVTG